MTVNDLIERLEKVEHKEAVVYLNDSDSNNNVCDRAIIEHDLLDDEIVVVLKT